MKHTIAKLDDFKMNLEGLMPFDFTMMIKLFMDYEEEGLILEEEHLQDAEEFLLSQYLNELDSFPADGSKVISLTESIEEVQGLYNLLGSSPHYKPRVRHYLRMVAIRAIGVLEERLSDIENKKTSTKRARRTKERKDTQNTILNRKQNSLFGYLLKSANVCTPETDNTVVGNSLEMLTDYSARTLSEEMSNDKVKDICRNKENIVAVEALLVQMQNKLNELK